MINQSSPNNEDNSIEDSRIILTSENSPEAAAMLDKVSDELIIENYDLYKELENA